MSRSTIDMEHLVAETTLDESQNMITGAGFFDITRFYQS